jgi:hypothetical protein
METAPGKDVVAPPFNEKPFVASWTSESLESDARNYKENHPTNRRDGKGPIGVKETFSHQPNHCDGRHTAQKRK